MDLARTAQTDNPEQLADIHEELLGQIAKIHVNRPHRPIKRRHSSPTVNNEENGMVQNVESFVYLGSKFTRNNNCSRDIQSWQRGYMATFSLYGKIKASAPRYYEVLCSRYVDQDHKER